MKKYFLVLVFVLFTFPAFATTDLIANVYTVLSDDYINQKDNKDILLKGLKAIKKIDNKLKFKATEDKLFMYYNHKMIKSFEFPDKMQTPLVWAEFTKEIINATINISPKIEIIDFELPDRFSAEVFDGLDGYSHYYSSFSDEADKPHVLRRNFASRLVDKDILLIKILAFRKDVSKQVETAVNECSKCKGLILDLRGNHGGLFDEALKITDMFLDEGIVTYTISKENIPPKFYTAKEGDILSNKPVVILIDGFSASASEILSAALSEQNRATLIGTNSYGKGTVQDVLKNTDGSAMALTTSYFYTPGGNKIDKKGLMPAICTGGLKSGYNITDGVCDKEDRFTNEADIEYAVKYIRNEL